jgi:hypothetical protein
MEQIYGKHIAAPRNLNLDPDAGAAGISFGPIDTAGGDLLPSADFPKPASIALRSPRVPLICFVSSMSRVNPVNVASTSDTSSSKAKRVAFSAKPL